MEPRIHGSSDTDKPFHSLAFLPDRLHDFDYFTVPAFTEAVFVKSSSDVFSATLKRLYEGAMEYDAPMQRTASHQSTTSNKSHRSQAARGRPRKHASYVSSSASSVAPSDKSLTSFPSFSPPSPETERILGMTIVDGSSQSIRKSSAPTSSIVDTLTTNPQQVDRKGLFDDDPVSTRNVPGAIHLANDEHIERLISKNGAVGLVRQIAEDLAMRDTQIAALRRSTDDRERALRKIILECGLSNMDLEKRLRAIEEEAKSLRASNALTNVDGAGLESMINEALSETVFGDIELPDATDVEAVTRAREEPNKSAKPTKGWKDYIWGPPSSGRHSRASSMNGVAAQGNNQANLYNARIFGVQPVFQTGALKSPEDAPIQNSSRASSVNSREQTKDRKSSTSLATLALRLVAGNSNTPRDNDSSVSNRGRSGSLADSTLGRAQSTASSRTVASAAGLTLKGLTKASTGRRISTVNPVMIKANRQMQYDRWDTMGTSPQKSTEGNLSENFGPVEMDAILPLEAQPPTLIQYNNNLSSEFLTDRFGFIYDQRRKKRQKEAAEIVRGIKNGERREMLSKPRGGISPSVIETQQPSFNDNVSKKPGSPTSSDDKNGDSKSIRDWQDHLKVTTLPTELLSHTPIGGNSTLVVLEGSDITKGPASGTISSEERGFIPTANTTSSSDVSVISGFATISKPTSESISETPKEDMEPVKLLLQQLGEVHDSLQREKTVKWNDFLRKVRAERRREGEVAAAALAATADSRSQRLVTIMPEANLTDGEMIGVAGLGNKGKVGRAKWNEFKGLVLNGIPVAYRAKIWAECSSAAALRVPGYYDDLVAQNGDDDDPDIVAQIQMDINRTLTDNIFFRRGPGVTKLNEVLLAYSRRNIEVGYCQGMNLITACLLLIMPTAEDAFWILTSIIENILPRGYYDHNLLASRADQQVLRQYVATILPKLSQHLDDLGIELEALTFQWFLSVFTDCLSAEALFRVWDVVLCTNDGSTFLFQIALALLKLNETQLLQCDSPAGIYTYINHQMTNHAISIDGLIHASEGLRKVVKREEVEDRRAKAIEAEKIFIGQREARNNLRRAEKLAGKKPANGAAEENGTGRVESQERASQASEQEDSGQFSVRTPVEEEIELGLG